MIDNDVIFHNLVYKEFLCQFKSQLSRFNILFRNILISKYGDDQEIIDKYLNKLYDFQDKLIEEFYVNVTHFNEFIEISDEYITALKKDESLKYLFDKPSIMMMFRKIIEKSTFCDYYADYKKKLTEGAQKILNTFL